jgi:predicted nuclease with TOPRIM domain
MNLHAVDLLSNLREWEEKESATKAREEQLLMRLQELEAVKREMNVQLERFRLDEQSSKQSLEQLLDKYEDARQKLVEYTMAHQNEVPAAKSVRFISSSISVRGCRHLTLSMVVVHAGTR